MIMAISYCISSFVLFENFTLERNDESQNEFSVEVVEVQLNLKKNCNKK